MAKTSRGPLFLIGKPRSGTKLMARILGQHPEIALEVSETQFIPYYLNRPHLIENLEDRERFNAFYDSVIKTTYFLYYSDNLIGRDEWYEACSEHSFEGVLEALLKYYSGRNDSATALWGDKSNNYVTHARLLKDGFPRAKFIHIVRDVRDAALSSYNAWGTNVYRYAQRWFDDLSILSRDLEGIPKDDYLQIRYEDLLRDPEKWIGECVRFLGLEFDPGILTLKESCENAGDAKSMKVIKSDNSGKFRAAFSPEKIRRIESITWPLLKEYGYTHAYDGGTERISPLGLRYYQALDVLHRLQFDVRRLGWARMGGVFRSLVYRRKNRSFS